MIGHDPGKQGSWYEEDYLVQQLLRILGGSVESVQWESRDEDGKGIDCWLRESGTRVAVQCKTRSGSWTLNRLGMKGRWGLSVLAYAKKQLAENPDCLYRFVCDTPCPELEELAGRARVEDDPERWWGETKEKLLTTLCDAWKLDANATADRALAHALTRRIAVFRTSREAFTLYNQETARLLCGQQGDALLSCLKDLARGSLTRELRGPDVEVAIEAAAISIEPRSEDPRVADRLGGLTQSFLERVAAARALELIPRQETESALAAFNETLSTTTVLVHGPAGCGKSEVLAAVVEALLEKRTPVLTLLPDQDEDEIGLGQDPVAALVRYAGGGVAALVLDQLDQVFMAGDRAQKLLRRCQRWLRRAREGGVRIVVGCRSVDAEHDTQLHHLLIGPTGEAPVSIAVDDLAEPVIAGILARSGIPLGELDPAVRGMAARPLFLKMLLDIQQQGGTLSGLRTTVAVVDRWWARAIASLPGIDPRRATESFDAVIHRMETEGLISAPREGSADEPALSALLSAGILIAEQRRGCQHLRPFHQVVADVRIASSWRDVDSPERLLQRLGPRPQQSLHHARRLRLLVPLLLERHQGPAMLDALMCSKEVRPILKRGVLLGLAAIDPVPADAVHLVRSWLDSELWDRVLPTVVRGQVAWTEALSEIGWIDEAWQQWPEDRKLRLLDMLAAVSTRWGDGVAHHLARWTVDDPAALDQAARIFLQQPGEDTDALFAIRLDFLARTEGQLFAVEWSKLLSSSPHRFAQLLAALLRQTDLKILCNSEWGQLLPGAEEVPPQVFNAGSPFWKDLVPWWYNLPMMRLQENERFNLIGSSLERIVELLARFLAHDLLSDSTCWQRLTGSLPSPHREVDGWLLLRVGANLPEGAGQTVAGLLADWFMSDPAWAHLRNHLGSKWAMPLARSFVARVGPLLSDEQYQRFETWIAEYSEDWTREDEERRLERDGGRLMPNPIGATAFRLLPMLEARLSARAGARLQELQRKFGGWLSETEWPADFVGGYVGSVIPDEVADRWSVQTWIARLTDRRLPEHGGKPVGWHKLGPDTIGEYTLRSLVSQLRRLTECSSRRYQPLACALDDSIAADVREAVLTGISRPVLSDRLTVKHEWEPLDDCSVAEIVLMPAYLEEPKCSRQIAWIVAERPSYPWPDQVVARLIGMAKDDTKTNLALESSMDLTTYRLNEDACVALHALGELARCHHDRRSQVLAVAASLVDHSDPGRRASSVAAAIQCFDTETEGASLILEAAADPEVACELDVIGPLFRLAVNETNAQETRAAARERLLALHGDGRERVARLGGEAAVALCWHEVLSEEELSEILTGGGSIRRGAARAVAVFLEEQSLPAWLRDLAVVLADDPDPKTGDKILQAFSGKAGDHLGNDPELLERLLGTAAFARRPDPIIRGCDSQDRLLPVADWVTQMVKVVAEASRAEQQTQIYRWHNGGRLVNLLSRLVEEAEREAVFIVRTAALDAWDALIEAGIYPAWTALDDRLQD